MKRQIEHGITAAGLLLALSGCERVLEVVDSIEASQQSGSNPPAQNAACACASSDSLMALTCGGGDVPLLDNDIVHTTPDGRVVAFSRCDENLRCEVVHWDGGTSRVLGPGFLNGLSASGQRVLMTSPPAHLELVDLSEGNTLIPLYEVQGPAPLSASGEIVIGSSDPLEMRQLARFHVDTGALEVLGEANAAMVRLYPTPDASTIVGWSSRFTDVLQDEGFRWNERGLTTEFPGVPNALTIWPEAVSVDGSVVAGRALESRSHFYWTEAGLYLEIASASWYSETFLSQDGQIVLGSRDPEGEIESEAFLWSSETGIIELTPGGASAALDLSDDGRVAVAYGGGSARLDGEGPVHTFIWDPVNGTRALDEVLAERGVDTSGWSFGAPRALSSNGKVLLGRADCGGVSTLYRAVLAD